MTPPCGEGSSLPSNPHYLDPSRPAPSLKLRSVSDKGRGFQIIKDSVSKWDRLKKRKYDTEAAFYHLVEEVGELATELVHQKRSPEKYSKEKLIDSIGDTLIFTFLLASLWRVDVEELIIKIINQDQARMSEIKNLKHKKR